MSENEEGKLKIYYSIREVAQLFGLNESTLRYWEKEFTEIAPPKNVKGTRYYRQEDIEHVRLIHHLLKEQQLTLSGARRQLRDHRTELVRKVEILERLRQVRDELYDMQEELQLLEKEHAQRGLYD